MNRGLLKLFPATLFFATLLIYLFFPTKNYYWDGVTFSLLIEDTPQLRPSLLHPNHLFYNVMGYGLYKATKLFSPGVRAIEVLRVTNSLLSVLTALLLFHILLEILGSTYLSAVVTVLFSFSATWWKFSTDANSYIPSIFFLLLGFNLLRPVRHPAPFRVAIVHAFSMLFHELSVFFYAVILLGIYQQSCLVTVKRKALNLLTYSAVASSLTLSAYIYCFFLIHGSFGVAEFARWITLVSHDASFSLDWWKNFVFTVRGSIRLFFGGRLSLALSSTKTLIPLLIFFLLALFVWQLVRHIKEIKSCYSSFKLEQPLKSVASLATLWILSYVVFLFFWLPHNTFYRLFYLPALVLLIGICLAPCATSRDQHRRRFRLALLVSAMALANFVFYIFPYSRVSTNPLLSVTLEMHKTWKPGTVVFFVSFTQDSATLKYFNPRTTWRALGDSDLKAFEKQLHDIHAQGGEAWLETTAIDRLSSMRGGEEWLDTHTDGRSKHEWVDNKYRIRLFRAFPSSVMEETARSRKR